MDVYEIRSPVFLIGMPRSGTSVLSESISLHEDLGWLSNYLNWFPSNPYLAILHRFTGIPIIGWYLRGTKKQKNGLLPSIRRLLPYSAEAFPVWSMLCGRKFLRDYLIGKKSSEQEREKTIAYIKTVLTCHGKKRFFAKFTGPPRIFYLRSVFPDACFVNVIRDPRAVVSSLMNVSFWRDGGGLEEPWWRNGFPEEYIKKWETHGKSPVALVALQWKRIVELTWQEKRLLPSDKYIEIKYEDFVSKPHEVLTSVFSIFGLRDSPIAHRYLLSIGKITNMNYKYLQLLSPGEIKLIKKLTHETARHSGYNFNLNE